ncbi:MAG: GNAT family N-acetyltransferase [Pseudomonadota bacterium]
MLDQLQPAWKSRLVSPEVVLDKIKPGMSIFLGTGVAEPRTLLKALISSDRGNIQDLELIQLISLGEALCVQECLTFKYRLKTFFSGWVASEAVASGQVDLAPCRFSAVPNLIASGAIGVDVAFVQITPPDAAGYCSLGVAVDAARQAMERASLVVGEINEDMPRTLGDAFVHMDDFNYLVLGQDPPMYLSRWPVDPVFDQVAANVAAVIEDGSCLGFGIGPLFEALGVRLSRRRHLGVHSPFFTDALMDLVKSGAVSNRRKKFFRGKCLASYGIGTKELMTWLHCNPLVEFQGVDVVADPRNIGQNDKYIAILPARKIDLTGSIAMHAGKGNVSVNPGEASEVFTGAAFSKGGRTIFALPSRNLEGQSNILVSVEDYPNQFNVRESLDMVATEFGVAYLTGRTLRERALALIDIAHPDHRKALVDQAKEARILYQDQIYLTEFGHLYPRDLESTHVFKGGLTLRFRPIKPSDEEEMRRLFYRFSQEAVYYRYFSPLKTMPHFRMQEYVSVDYKNTMSIVGLTDDSVAAKIVAEARYAVPPGSSHGDLAMVVDEGCQGLGVASHLLDALIKVALERGLAGITADVLPDNRAMWKVLEKAPYRLTAEREPDFYHMTLSFANPK